MRGPRGYKTARSIAQKLGIHENRYTRYERAEVEPNLALLMQICRALDVTPNDLITAIITDAGVLEAPYVESIAAAFERQS